MVSVFCFVWVKNSLVIHVVECSVVTFSLTASSVVFDAQVKPFGADGTPFKSAEDYVAALTAHHAVMIAAMKAKQTVSVAGADALDKAVAEFAKMYVPA